MFKHIKIEEQLRRKQAEMLQEMTALKPMLTAVRKMVRVDELTEEELEEMVDLYDEYKVNHKYEKDDIFKYEGKLYKVIKGLTSQEDWKPDKTPSEYYPLMPENVIAPWEQRYGHNPYLVGERVLWQGEVYELIKAEGSPYTPSAYPQGWELILAE